MKSSVPLVPWAICEVEISSRNPVLSVALLILGFFFFKISDVLIKLNIDSFLFLRIFQYCRR